MTIMAPISAGELVDKLTILRVKAERIGEDRRANVRHELALLQREAFYERRVFFVQGLGFVTPSAARRISLEEARRFEAIHERTYRAHGFELVPIGPGSLLDRAAAIRRAL